MTLYDFIYLQYTNSLLNYKWLLGSIISPVANLLFIYPIVAWNKYNGQITQENTNISHKTLFVIAFFDFISNLLYIISLPYLSFLFISIVGKFSLFVMMCISYIFIHRRYFINHYIGAIVTIGGVCLTFIHQSTNAGDDNFIFIVLYLLSIFIHSFNYVYKEKYIKKTENLNIFWMIFWINIWQFVIGICSFPIILIPLKGLYNPLHNFWSYMNNGLQCQFLGINSEYDTNCKFSLLWLVITELFAIYAVYLGFIIIKKGSSVIENMIITIKLPIVTIIGYLLIKYNIIHTTNSQKYTIYIEDYFSMVFIVIGSCIYFVKREYTPPNNLSTSIDTNITNKNTNEQKYKNKVKWFDLENNVTSPLLEENKEHDKQCSSIAISDTNVSNII